MSTSITKSSFTPDDLLEMPDGDMYELVDGQLVERNMSAQSSAIAVRLMNRMGPFIEAANSGLPLGSDCSFRCFQHDPDDPDKVRRADASFIRAGRLAQEQFERGHVPIAPDLVVEVMSPNDLYWQVAVKVEEWLAAGVQLVWVVDPTTRTVRVLRPDGSDQRLHETDTLDGESVLPGFRCPVADLFPSVGAGPQVSIVENRNG